MRRPRRVLRVKLNKEHSLMQKYTLPNLRLGATSFLLHAAYVPAVRFAAESMLSAASDAGVFMEPS